jgi:hypothetical protein
MVEITCGIAASYEAKCYGVKTGTPIREARILCPEIAIVEAKLGEYIKVHHRVIEAVEGCIHVEAVCAAPKSVLRGVFWGARGGSGTYFGVMKFLIWFLQGRRSAIATFYHRRVAHQ